MLAHDVVNLFRRFATESTATADQHKHCLDSHSRWVHGYSRGEAAAFTIAADHIEVYLCPRPTNLSPSQPPLVTSPENTSKPLEDGQERVTPSTSLEPLGDGQTPTVNNHPTEPIPCS